MPAFIAKNQSDILRHALTKLSDTTPLTAVAPGSIVRSLTEVFAKELGDLYGVLDFNMSQAFLTTATGRALDLIGALYNAPRKTMTQVATIDQGLGVFYFYLDSPYNNDIAIPANTQITTNATDYVGQQYTYRTTEEVRIPAGRLRVYAGIRPSFSDSVFTAGANTLTVTNFNSPVGTFVKCTNPKPVPAQIGYELDEAYRTRISKAVRVSASGTTEAVRFAALAVSGIRDAKVRTAKFGLGSFEVIITPENQAVTGPLMTTVSEVLEAIRPVGVRMYIRVPEYVPVEVSAVATIRDFRNVNKVDLARKVEVATLRYINTLLAGQPLVFNQLIQSMMDSSDAVVDISIRTFKVNGTEALRRNITVEEDEQLVPGAISVSYAV